MRRAVRFGLALGLIAAIFPPAAALQTTTDLPVRVGGNIPPPTKVKDVKPVYPPAAQRARVAGVVVVEATIGEDGKVRDARVLRSIPLLDQASIEAVRQWEFTPTVVDGKPRAVVMTVTVNFALLGAPQTPAVPTAAAPVPATQAPGLIRLFAYRPQNAGALVAWEITLGRGSTLPHWNPETQSPPLPVVDAARIARVWLTGGYPQVQRFELQSANLSHVRRSADIDFWYYQLTFNGYGQPQPPAGPFLAVVLPDGSVAEPTDTSATTGVPPAERQPPPEVVARASALFQEAREVIPLADSPTPLATREQIQAGLFAELAIAELPAFPGRSSDDAERAVEFVKRLPGGGRDIERADVYQPIVLAAPVDQVREIAMECRRIDGSYPYAAIADRIRAMTAEEAARRTLLDETYAAAPMERTFKDRSLALTFIERTYDLVPAALAAAAVEKLLAGMVADPALNDTRADRDEFGPTILELMTRLDSDRAAAIATAHPAWDTERKQPGRTPFNPVGGAPGATFQPSQIVPRPPDVPRLPGPIPPLPADLEAELQTVRGLSASERASRLIALARALMNH